MREIGRGGFGVVYEARDRELGRSVAFKAVRVANRPDLREDRVLREADVAARLSHPNVVTLFDAGTCEHGPFLVLELLHGETLAQRLEKGRVGVHEALRISIEIAKGIAHAHSRDVVHRDVSPRNVFLCDDGQVKLLDLGMAHAFGRRRVVGGTPAFMAPEQWRGAPEDERTDVYALGVILYRMLADELPFGETPEDRRRSRAAPPLSVRGAPGLGELVGRMLATDPFPASHCPAKRSSKMAMRPAPRRPLPRRGCAHRAGPRRHPARRRQAGLRLLRRQPPGACADRIA